MFPPRFSLWAKAHAKTGQISVREGEDGHEADEPAVMVKEDGKVDTRLDVTQHEEGHENQATHNHCR